jgi:hypothetical protein
VGRHRVGAGSAGPACRPLDGVFPTRIDREDIPALVAALAEARREQGIPHSPGPLIKLTSTSLATQSAPARRAA